MSNYSKKLVRVDFFRDDQGLSVKIQQVGTRYWYLGLRSPLQLKEYLEKTFDHIQVKLGFDFDSYRFYLTFNDSKDLRQYINLAFKNELEFISSDYDASYHTGERFDELVLFVPHPQLTEHIEIV